MEGAQNLELDFEVIPKTTHLLATWLQANYFNASNPQFFNHCIGQAITILRMLNKMFGKYTAR